MSDVTRVLSAIGQGDSHATEQLLPLVYEELRRLAAHRLCQESPGQTLQATALVHEAYVRLVDTTNEQHWDNRGHFYFKTFRFRDTASMLVDLRPMLLNSSVEAEQSEFEKVFASITIIDKTLGDFFPNSLYSMLRDPLQARHCKATQSSGGENLARDASRKSTLLNVNSAPARARFGGMWTAPCRRS